MKAIVRAKRKGSRSAGAYVRYSLKMLYISSAAMMLLGECDYIRIYIGAKENSMVLQPAYEAGEDAFKLARVNETKCARRIETKCARRIETNNALLSFLDAGFPRWAIGKRLPVVKCLDGSLGVDLRPQIPIDYKMEAAE